MAGNKKSERIGLSVALSTPFNPAGDIDLKRLVIHAERILKRGADGLTLFGTTGEGASVSLAERHQALGALSVSGIDLRKQVILSVAASTVSDAVEQARVGYDLGCKALLVAPPFYFGQTSDDGLFRFFAAMFERLGGQLRDIILYHIPGMTRNQISIELTHRLMAAFPGAIIGVKDSNGDWAATERRLNELKDLQILVGDERQLARAVRNGGGGTICGLANIAPELLRPLAHEGIEDTRVNQMVEAIVSYSFMSAVKAMIAHDYNDPEWRNMRAPLSAMPEGDAAKLASLIATIRATKT